MTEKLSINQQPIEDRPREKLMSHGAESLSKAELLAILIGSGNSRETAVELMQRVRSISPLRFSAAKLIYKTLFYY